MTRVLALSGFTLPSDLLPPQDDNPSGFWESRVLARLNDKILGALGSDWDDIFAPDETALNFDDRERFERDACAAFDAEFGEASQIVIKDPRCCLLTGFWKRALARSGFRADFVLTVRNPLEVAGSLHARNGFIRDKSLLLWLAYMLRAERETRNAPRAFVLFDDLLARPVAVLHRLASSLPDAIGPLAPASVAAIDRFVRSDLRHHTGEDGFSLGPVDQWARTVFEILRTAARGGAVDVAGLDDVSSALARHGEVLAPLHADLSRHVREVGVIVEELRRRNDDTSAEVDALRSQRDGLEAQLEAMNYQAEARATAEAELAKALSEIRRIDASLATALSERDHQEILHRTAEVDLAAAMADLEEVRAQLAAAHAAADEQARMSAASREAAERAASLLGDAERAAAAHAEALRREKDLARAANGAAAAAQARAEQNELARREAAEAARVASEALMRRSEEVEVLLERATSLATSLGRSQAAEAEAVSRAKNNAARAEQLAAERDEARGDLARALDERRLLSRELAEQERRWRYLQGRWWWRGLDRLRRASARDSTNAAGVG